MPKNVKIQNVSKNSNFNPKQFLVVLLIQLRIKQKKGSFCALALILSLLVLLLATASIKAFSAAMALFILPYPALPLLLSDTS